MKTWPVQDAKAKFSELLRASLRDGPQLVTLRGKEVAVLAPADEWRRLKLASTPSLKALLLGSEPRFEVSVPDRKQAGLKPRPVDFRD